MGNENSINFCKEMKFKETPSEEETQAALSSLKQLEKFFEKYDDTSFFEKFSKTRQIVQMMEKINKDKTSLELFEEAEKKRRDLEKDYYVFINYEYENKIKEIIDRIEETEKTEKTEQTEKIEQIEKN